MEQFKEQKIIIFLMDKLTLSFIMSISLNANFSKLMVLATPSKIYNYHLYNKEHNKVEFHTYNLHYILRNFHLLVNFILYKYFK